MRYNLKYVATGFFIGFVLVFLLGRIMGPSTKQFCRYVLERDGQEDAFTLQSLPVDVITANPQSVYKRLFALGEIKLKEGKGNTITSELQNSTKLIKINFKPGDWVEEGQVLFKFKDAEAKGNYNRAKARLSNAEANFKRAESLLKSGNMHQEAYDKIKGEKGVAAGELETAKAQLDKTVIKGAATIKIPQRKSVHERPDMANEFGHWEGDLMSFKGNTQFILTLLEKTTRYNVSIRLESKKSEHVIGEISKVFDKLPPEAKKSITFDNGLEFYNHSDLKEKHKIETYFCDPYKSWQKGAIENTNGRLRRDLPRSTEVKEMLEQDFQDTIRMNNKIPRKCLDFNDPETLFYNHLEEIALHA